MNLGTNRPNLGNGKKGADRLTDLRISVCSACRRGIFATQPRRWSSGQTLGLVHDRAADCTPIGASR
jgi:hypothetical protein